MATNLDFSRAVELNLKTNIIGLFTAVLIFARDDAGAVNFGSDALKFKVYKDNWSSTATIDWDSGDAFLVSTATLTFNSALNISDLGVGVHKYQLYNVTSNQAIAFGDFEVI